MNTHNFKLITNKLEQINETISYFINNDNINFKIGNTLYRYNLIDDILFKTDDSLSLTIDPNNNIIYIKLVENGLEFNMPMENSKIIKNADEIIIKYAYIGDELMENEIHIKR